MYVGTYYHTLESKGRFSLPKAFRQQESDWVLTAGLDGCIFVFAKKQFESEVEKLTKLSYYQADHRAIIRHLASHAQEEKPDGQGRITISPDLQTYAQLKKQIVVVGSLSRIEIWDVDRYHQLFDNLAQTVEISSEKINL